MSHTIVKDEWNNNAVAFCGDCGSPCTVVRPGKTQCDPCSTHRALRTALWEIVEAWDDNTVVGAAFVSRVGDTIERARKLLSESKHE